MTSSAVSGASTGRELTGSSSASRYASTAVLARRAMVTAVGCVRCRTTVSVTGVRCAMARAAAPIWVACRLRKTGMFIGTAARAGGTPA